MILYSFSDRSHLQACRTKGIEHGFIPYTVVPADKGRTRKLINWDTFQWLTSNASFIPMVPGVGPPKTAVLQGRKQEFRLKVRIPWYGRGRLRSWIEFAKARQVPLRTEINKDLGAPEEWWIYAGIIPSSWIIETARNPTAPDWLPPPVKPQELRMDTTGLGRGDPHMGPAQPII